MSYTYDKNTWSGQYYATLDKPCGYYDLSVLSTLENVPAESELFALTKDQWDARMDGSSVLCKAVVDGVWGDYTPPAIVVPLTTQAQNALSTARTYIYNNYGILNEATPDDWVTYLKALMAIANGSDTTSTALPTQPAS